MLVKSLFLFIIFSAMINGGYSRNGSKKEDLRQTNEVSAPSEFSKMLFKVLDGTILFLSTIIHSIDAGIDEITGIAALPQEAVVQLIIKAVSWLERKGYHKITSIVGNGTILEAAENLFLKTQICLVDSSVDLPKFMARKLLHCVTDPLEEVIKTGAYVVEDIKSGIELLAKLIDDHKRCKNGVGCLKGLSAILANGTKLARDFFNTAKHGGKLLTVAGNEIPACFAERLSVAPVNKLRQSGVDFLKCFIDV